MSARETRQKYIQEWKGSSFAFHYSPLASLYSLIQFCPYSFLLQTASCLYYRLKIRARANYTRRARPGGLTESTQYQIEKYLSVRPACSVSFGSRAERVFHPLSYFQPMLETTRSLFFTAKVDLVRLFSSQCLKFQTLRALELLRKFENIAGVQLYLHDKYQRILFQYGRYMFFEISYRTGPCCSKGGYHQTY